jgi:hypothetical protein
MNAATVHTLPPSQDRVTVALTTDERAAIASACLGMAVQMFAGADRLEAQGLWAKADALRHDALVLSRAELSVRNASR